MINHFVFALILFVLYVKLSESFSSRIHTPSRIDVSSYKPPHLNQFHKTRSISQNLNLVNTDNDALADVIQPAKIDGRAIFLTLAGQGLLLNLAFIIGNFLGIDVLDLKDLETEAEILRDTFEPSLIIAAIVIATGFALRNTKLQGTRTHYSVLTVV